MTTNNPSFPAKTRIGEQRARGKLRHKYLLKLYVSGATPRSTRAILNLKAICEKYLPGAYNLEVIDIYQQPALAKDDQIIAAPTLIKQLPPPLRRFIGDLSQTEKVLFGLDLLPTGIPLHEDKVTSPADHKPRF